MGRMQKISDLTSNVASYTQGRRRCLLLSLPTAAVMSLSRPPPNPHPLLKARLFIFFLSLSLLDPRCAPHLSSCLVFVGLSSSHSPARLLVVKVLIHINQNGDAQTLFKYPPSFRLVLRNAACLLFITLSYTLLSPLLASPVISLLDGVSLSVSESSPRLFVACQFWCLISAL